MVEVLSASDDALPALVKHLAKIDRRLSQAAEDVQAQQQEQDYVGADAAVVEADHDEVIEEEEEEEEEATDGAIEVDGSVDKQEEEEIKDATVVAAVESLLHENGLSATDLPTETPKIYAQVQEHAVDTTQEGQGEVEAAVEEVAEAAME